MQVVLLMGCQLWLQTTVVAQWCHNMWAAGLELDFQGSDGDKAASMWLAGTQLHCGGEDLMNMQLSYWLHTPSPAYRVSMCISLMCQSNHLTSGPPQLNTLYQEYSIEKDYYSTSIAHLLLICCIIS
jgi:hypothetical protein